MTTTRMVAFVGLAIVFTTMAAAQPVPVTLAIRNGLLIDGTGKPPAERTTIFVARDRISRIVTGEVSIPADVRAIDATGLTVLPGFMDMHIHHRPWMWPLFLRFGITTIRDVGSDPELILAQRDRERRGELVAPRIFACGPLLDGVPPVWGIGWRGSVGLTSADEAKATAQRLLDRGVDCLKVYVRLPAPLMRAIVDIATERGVPVTGHVGTVAAREAVEMGVQSIEHASGILFLTRPEESESVIRVLVDRGAFIVATLLVYENSANLQSIGNPQYQNLDLVPQDEVRWWLDWRNDFRFRDATEESFARARQGAAARAAFIRAFRRAGGKVVAGSDTPNPFVIPGVSLHQELERLVAAGLSPMEAIMSATSVAAALLRRADLGVIEEGKIADMVLVSGNPSIDITATRSIRVVIKGGTIVHDWR